MSSLAALEPVDFYFKLVSKLSADAKLDLIARLSQSLKSDKQANKLSIDELFGAWKSDESAEEIIDFLRASRSSDRTIEPL